MASPRHADGGSAPRPGAPGPRAAPAIALAAALLAACAAPASRDPPLRPSTTVIGLPMPPLADLPPVAGAAPSMEGGVTVVEFGSSTCAGCRTLAPALDGLPARFPAGAVRLVRVRDGRREPPEGAATAADATASPVLLDPEGALFDALGVRATPTVFVVGADGRILWTAATARIELIEEWATDALARARSLPPPAPGPSPR